MERAPEGAEVAHPQASAAAERMQQTVFVFMPHSIANVPAPHNARARFSGFSESTGFAFFPDAVVVKYGAKAKECEAMKRSELEDEIRQVILSSVEVDGLTAADLPADVPLFGEGVGLDSIDALEIGAALRKKYQVKFKANSDENKIHFRSVGSLAAFIAANAGIALEENA